MHSSSAQFGHYMYARALNGLPSAPEIGHTGAREGPNPTPGGPYIWRFPFGEAPVFYITHPNLHQRTNFGNPQHPAISLLKPSQKTRPPGPLFLPLSHHCSTTIIHT